MKQLVLRNRQRVRRVNTPLLRRIARGLLGELCGEADYELGVHLIAASEMARINQQFLQHEGSTDVITFDHGCRETSLHGEIFICVDDAIVQARQFKTSWQSEVTRYVIHGVLHLLGHDDLQPPARKKMKREESRLLREISRQFPLRKLSAAND